LHADRIVIGSESEAASSLLQQIYAPLLNGEYYEGASTVPGARTAKNPPILLSTTPTSAEIIKHASNAFLAMKISFINLVSNLCEATGADIEDVAHGIGLDKRIGRRFLRPGIGYGGSCFPKDVAALRCVAGEFGVNMDLLAEVERINVAQQSRFIAKLRTTLWTLRGKRIGVLGLAFKSDTDDIRESPAIAIIAALLAEGCLITAYDPAAMDCTAAMLPPSSTMSYAENEYAAARDASALLILTDWPQFSTLDLPRLRRIMQYPIVLDGRNIYRPEKMQQHGFTYISAGRPTVTPANTRAGEALRQERA
jgi:UDPglucose 6-dehydrogenase